MSRPIRKGDLALAAPGAPLKAGQVQFYQAILPPLQANEYQLEASQRVNLPGKSADSAPIYVSSEQFAIRGPRFRLEANSVQQVYPPANLAGEYNGVLPHVVLRTRTLPWARSLDGSPAKGKEVPPPWIALLTLYPSDLVWNGTRVEIQQGTVEKFLTSRDRVIVPGIDQGALTADELNEPLMYIELPQKLFLGIAPTLDDLPFLAHAREVNTDGKEILGLEEDGYFSVVVGNRMPMAGKDAEPTLNTVLLVSLEGLQQELPVEGKTPPKDDTESRLVRICVLASWTFPCTASAGEFLEIMQHLSVDRLRMPLVAPGSSAPADTLSGQAEALARQALEWGYVPLLNNTRSGEETTSWYRGPCVPVGTSPDVNGPYRFSDHAIRYDPGPDDKSSIGTGMFDMSYACAWQIGRLMALSNGPFAAELAQWRRQLAAQHNEQQAKETLMSRLPGGHLLAAGAAENGVGLMETARPLLHDLLRRMGEAATNGAIPQRTSHAERDLESLPAMLTATESTDPLSQSGDPVANLVRRVVGTIPARAARKEKP